MPKRVPATARARLADYAAPDAGMAEARSRYDGRLEAVMNEIKALTAGRKVHDLTGDDAARLRALRAKFDALLIYSDSTEIRKIPLRICPGPILLPA